MSTSRALLILGQDMANSYHNRGRHICEQLARHYREVDLVSITKMYAGSGADPVWKKALFSPGHAIKRRVETTHRDGVTHYVVRMVRLPTVLDYLLRDYWTYVNLRSRLREHYDVCILAHPRLAFVGLQLRRQGRVGMLVYDDWDYFPALQPKDRSWRLIMQRRERECVQGADGVVSVSSTLQELRRKQGARNTAVVPNVVDYALFEGAQTKEPHAPTLLYMGSLSEDWGADLPILALPSIAEFIPDLRYLVLGQGQSERQLRAIARKTDSRGAIQFCGSQRYEALPRFLAQADVGVATSRDTEFRRYACPLKIAEYMAGGLPVIGTSVGETKVIIEKSMAGEAIDFCVDTFARTVVNLLSDRSNYERFSANAVAYARNHDWQKLLDRHPAFGQPWPKPPEPACAPQAPGSGR